MERRCIHAIILGSNLYAAPVTAGGLGTDTLLLARRPPPVQGGARRVDPLSLLILNAIEMQRLCGAPPEISYWRTPTKIAGDKPLETLPRASALPSALIAPL
jgi:hypothetical protein